MVATISLNNASCPTATTVWVITSLTVYGLCSMTPPPKGPPPHGRGDTSSLRFPVPTGQGPSGPNPCRSAGPGHATRSSRHVHRGLAHTVRWAGRPGKRPCGPCPELPTSSSVWSERRLRSRRRYAMTRPVTVGVDGSPAGLAAADWGAREAQLRGAPLRLVHAWEWQPYAHAPPAGPEDSRRWSEEVPRQVTTQLRRRYPDLGITADLLTGPPSEVLREASKEAELLVIGSVSVGRLAGFLLGSVAMATVAHAERPVVLVRAPRADEDEHPGQGPATTPPRQVVVGLDLGRPCDQVIRFSFEAAELRAAALLVVHGWNPPGYYGVHTIGADSIWAADIKAMHAEDLRKVLLPWREKYPAVDVVEQAVVGQPAGHLLDAAATADLVVIGRRTPSPRAAPFRIGHIAHAVLHHCPAPVAIVPHD
ncbi:universal stress protein [Streptomyces nigrescens]|uniref:universal stress protein n=1 Tax=Streptomyces nigrescens TaxID=1920 RepID=UPI0037008680